VSKTLLHVLFGGQRGGCETNALELIRGTPMVRHRIAVLGQDGPMCEVWREAGAIVEVYGREATSIRGAKRAIEAVIEKINPDAAMLWHGLVQLPQLIHVLNPLKIPICVHGGNPAHTMKRLVDWRYCLLANLYPLRGPLPTYICCSQYVADSFEASRYLRRFPRVVVYNGVKQPQWPLHQPRELSSSDAPVIGMLARLSSIKDHATLIRAMPTIRKQYPNAVLELAGDGDLREPLTKLAVELEIVDAVHFLGDISDAYAVISRWDLFAYATTEREGLGNALAEAMMFGMPCVVTDVGPMREFGSSENAIELVAAASPNRLAEVVIESLKNLPDRLSSSQRSKTFASMRFCPNQYAVQYRNLLRL